MSRARLEQGKVFEAAVGDRLRAHGWTVEPFGQALLSEAIRTALRRHAHLPLRWMPDLLAVRGDDLPVMVDAKGGRTDTPNYAIERDAFDGALRWWWAMRTQHWIVWHDFHWSTIDQISQGLRDGVIRDGHWRGNGSGTPFLLIPKMPELRSAVPL